MNMRTARNTNRIVNKSPAFMGGLDCGCQPHKARSHQITHEGGFLYMEERCQVQ